jgi:excinuclease ABC subunit A
VPYSPATGLPIEAQTVSNMVDRVMALPEGTRLYLLAPVVRGRKGEYRRELAEWQKAGFTRVRIDGEMYPIEEAPALDKKFKHDVEVVVDRLAVKEGIETRLADSFEQALRLADGLAYVDLADGVVPGRENEGEGGGAMKGAGLPANRIVFSEKFACPVSGFTIEEVEPRLFSFNAPQGACPTCDGIGEKQLFDPQLVVPNEALTLKKGAVVPWAKSNPPSPYYMQVLASLAKEYEFSLETPWEDFDKEIRDIILFGTKGRAIPLTFKDGRKSYTVKKAFEGVIGNLNRRLLQTESAWMREELSKFQTAQPCETCNGKRLNEKALAVKIPGPSGVTDIATPTKMSVADAKAWFLGLPEHLNDQQSQIAKAILKEINERLGFLDNVGLDYLNLDRTSGTLSGGESQRIRLASQIGSGLSGVLYVLDEPSIGLHQRDNDRLLETLKRLRDLGNTVIVVEHDEDAIRAADYVVDLGPGAGVRGGEVVAEGTLKQVLKSRKSLTADYLTGRREIAVPGERRKGNGKQITVHGARANNLNDVTASIPLGTFTCVTGVSGSGKSSFTIDTRNAEPATLAAPRDRGDQQVDLVEALQGFLRRRAHAERRAHRGGRARQGHRARPLRQGDRDRPVPHRPHSAIEPRHLYRRLHPDPRLVRRPPRSAGARLQARPLQLQRQGRPVRGVPGRRPDQDRDALPARRLRHLRGMRRQALQPRNAGGEVQGSLHRRRARHDGGGCGNLLRKRPPHPR